jgi:hypothetical protein
MAFDERIAMDVSPRLNNSQDPGTTSSMTTEAYSLAAAGMAERGPRLLGGISAGMLALILNQTGGGSTRKL